jgi:hypothetical protein
MVRIKFEFKIELKKSYTKDDLNEIKRKLQQLVINLPGVFAVKSKIKKRTKITALNPVKCCTVITFKLYIYADNSSVAECAVTDKLSSYIFLRYGDIKKIYVKKRAKEYKSCLLEGEINCTKEAN